MNARQQVTLQQERTMDALLKSMLETEPTPVRVRVMNDDEEDEMVAFDFRPLIPELVLVASDAL